MASSCGDSEGPAGEPAGPSQLSAEGCPAVLHELSNLMTGVLLNAQMLEWKLPPYSHLKRPVREVARNAQRSSELMKRLLRRCAEAGRTPFLFSCSHGPRTHAKAANATRVPTAYEAGPDAHVELPSDLTSECDARTSDVFPKRDDSSER